VTLIDVRIGDENSGVVYTLKTTTGPPPTAGVDLGRMAQRRQQERHVAVVGIEPAQLALALADLGLELVD
jgi:hypothetical protein